MILRGIHIICLQTTFSLGFCNSQAGTGVYMRITSLFSCDQGKELSITCATCPLIAELHRMKAAPKLTTQRQGIERIYNRTRGIDASGAQLKLFPCHWNMQSPCQPKASFLGCVLCSQNERPISDSDRKLSVRANNLRISYPHPHAHRPHHRKRKQPFRSRSIELKNRRTPHIRFLYKGHTNSTTLMNFFGSKLCVLPLGVACSGGFVLCCFLICP